MTRRRFANESRLLAAIAEFERVFRAFEVTASAVDRPDFDLETDIEILVNNAVIRSTVPPPSYFPVDLVHHADGLLYLAGTRLDKVSSALAVSMLNAVPDDYPWLEWDGCYELSEQAPRHRTQYYPSLAFPTLGSRQRNPYLIAETDIGHHSVAYWLMRAYEYMTNPRVRRVAIIKLFPLRHHGLVAGLWQRAGLALVLGRTVDPRSNRTVVCILEEKSFGNVPLVANICELLVSVPSSTQAAPRAELTFAEPAYAGIDASGRSRDGSRGSCFGRPPVSSHAADPRRERWSRAVGG